MSDITDLFHRTAPDADAAPSPDTVEADLARGRTAMIRVHRQRTIRRSMLAGGTLVVGVAVAIAATQLGGSSTPKAHNSNPAPRTPVVVKHHHQKTHQQKASTIKLVSYDGAQLAGFTVDKVPDGWHLSTSTQYALLIDPAGDKDNDPDAFVGKLAVLTQSTDVHGLGKGDPVTVNGQPGVVAQQGKYGESLTYNDPNGFGVVIQAPPALGWGDSQIVAFAEGVHVTGNALPSHG